MDPGLWTHSMHLKCFHMFIGNKQVIMWSCFAGISACQVALAAFVCGKEDVAIYDGSWVEWFQRAKPNQMEDVPTD